MHSTQKEDSSSLNIGFVGCGQMGFAIAQALSSKLLKSPKQIIAFDPNAERQIVSKNAGFTIAETLDGLKSSDLLILCVKPHYANQVCSAAITFMQGKLVISVMAGINIEKLMNITNNKCRVCQVFTSLAASVGEAVSAYTTSDNCTTDDTIIIDKIVNSFGISIGKILDSSSNITMAIAGSGPAFLSVVIDAIADAGVSNGLTRDVSLKLAAGMMKGTASLLLETKIHPAQLKDSVCSPGGMSIRGIEQIEDSSVRSAFIKAINAACRRGNELA